MICNAGVMAVPTRCETLDGFEMQYGSSRDQGNRKLQRLKMYFPLNMGDFPIESAIENQDKI